MKRSPIDILRKNSQALEPIATGIEVKLQKLESIEAVMFDVYGTLFVSGSGDVGHAAANPTELALVEAGKASGVQLDEPPSKILNRFYEEIRRWHQLSKRDGIEFPEVDIIEIWRGTLSNLQLDDATFASLAVEFESRSNPVWPMPTLKETLSKLAQSFQLGIVSNAQFFTLDLFEALAGFSRAAIGFERDLEVYSFAEKTAKPGKEIYEIAAERLTKKGIRPENVLYVGNDMLNDIMGGQRVGFRTALFAGDQRSLRLRQEDQRVDGVVPDIIVNCLSQIPDCLHLPG